MISCQIQRANDYRVFTSFVLWLTYQWWLPQLSATWDDNERTVSPAAYMRTGVWLGADRESKIALDCLTRAAPSSPLQLLHFTNGWTDVLSGLTGLCSLLSLLSADSTFRLIRSWGFTGYTTRWIISDFSFSEPSFTFLVCWSFLPHYYLSRRLFLRVRSRGEIKIGECSLPIHFHSIPQVTTKGLCPHNVFLWATAQC